MYTVHCIQYSGRTHVDVEQLFDGIENGIIKTVRFPDGREYDVSKVVLISKDTQSCPALQDDITFYETKRSGLS